MSSISRSIKEKKRRKRGENGPPLLPVHVQYEPAHIRDVRQKLETVPEYANCTKEELNGLAADLTHPDTLKSSYFGSYDEYRSPAASPMASLCSVFQQQFVGLPPAPDPAEEILHVKIIITTPSSGQLRLRVPSLQSQGACVGGGGGVVSTIEEEYGKRVLKASIDVNGQILTWDNKNLIIPQGRPLPDAASPPASLCLGARLQVREEPEHRVEQHSLQPCPGDKLDAFLKVVSIYNKNYTFDPNARNSIHFVLDALKALGFTNPPQVLHNRYNKYFSELKKKISGNVPKGGFKDHAALEHFLRHATNFLKVKKNCFDVEFLLNYYVRFHWELGKSQALEPGKWVCPEPEECAMETLESEIKPEQMLLNQFR